MLSPSFGNWDIPMLMAMAITQAGQRIGGRLAFIITGVLPGIVLAGVIHILTFSRKFIFSLLCLCSLLAFPVAYLNGGSGYGPLVTVFLLSYVMGGLWIGLALGSWALPPRNPHEH